MILIGLQNADKKYEKTRHNAGAIVLKYLVEKNGGEFTLDKYTNCFKANLELGEKSLQMFLPNTFMNLSGESVLKVLKNLEIKKRSEKERVYVFFDDATIPVGGVKMSVGEGASSHNGIKSIVDAFESVGLTKDDFTRVRIGVGKVMKDESGRERLYEPGPEKFSDFVLGNLNQLEIVQIQGLAEKIIGQIVE
jgi:PTH1 family peptidyl-tRNA hydrolase